MRFKGPIFPSFLTQGPAGIPSGQDSPDRKIKAGQCYIGGDSGRAATRFLKQQCRPILKSKDPEIQAAIELVDEALPDPYMKYQFIYRAKKITEENLEITLIQAMNYLLARFAEAAETAKNKLNKTAKQQEVIDVVTQNLTSINEMNKEINVDSNRPVDEGTVVGKD